MSAWMDGLFSAPRLLVVWRGSWPSIIVWGVWVVGLGGVNGGGESQVAAAHSNTQGQW
jgi:hypothetical protein